MTSSHPVTLGMELLRWTLTNQAMINQLAVDVFRSRWLALFDSQEGGGTRVPQRLSFETQRSVEVVLTSRGISVGAYHFFWRDPRHRYRLGYAVVQRRDPLTEVRLVTRVRRPHDLLWLVFRHRFFPGRGVPAAIQIPILAQLTQHVAEMAPMLQTLGNPPKASSPEEIAKRLPSQCK